MVVAVRNTGLQRLYSSGQIEQLRLLKRWIDAGLSASEAHERLRVHGERLSAVAVTDDVVAPTAEVLAQAAAGCSQANALLEDAQSNRARMRDALHHLSVNRRVLREHLTELGETLTKLSVVSREERALEHVEERDRGIERDGQPG